MRMQSTLKPWATCSPGKLAQGREMLALFCYLDVQKALLVATDGRCLSRTPVEVEPGDVSGLVHVDALKAAAKLAGKRGDAVIDCAAPDAVKLADGRTWPRALPDGRKEYPHWEQVVPTYKGKSTVRLEINPVLLAAVFEAMGAREACGVVLEFQVDDEGDARQAPILVSSAGMSGVLMPMRIKSRAPSRLDDVEQAHAVALGEKDNNAVDAANAARGVR